MISGNEKKNLQSWVIHNHQHFFLSACSFYFYKSLYYSIPEGSDANEQSSRPEVNKGSYQCGQPIISISSETSFSSSTSSLSAGVKSNLRLGSFRLTHATSDCSAAESFRCLLFEDLGVSEADSLCFPRDGAFTPLLDFGSYAGNVFEAHPNESSIHAFSAFLQTRPPIL